MKCAYCNKEFPDEELELSHDIPKYMGGNDANGRHYLCKVHHRLYEGIIIDKCLSLVGGKIEDLSEISRWCYLLKVKYPHKHKEFRIIAQKVKEDFYGKV